MDRPSISILVPTFRRFDLLERNLDSCGVALASFRNHFEVVVGDNAGDSEARELVASFVSKTGVSGRYLGEPVTQNMQENHIRLAEAASGRYLNFVHDDDFLLPNAGESLLEVVAESSDYSRPIKNAVHLVDLAGKLRRVEGRHPPCDLSSKQAIQRLISESSFVRFPSMLIPKESLISIGGFDAGLGYIFDLGAWLSLASKFGLRLSGRATAAFTIHPGSETNTMFTRDFLERVASLLALHSRNVGLPESQILAGMRKFLWRFALAGCLRAIKSKNLPQLRSRSKLLSDLPLINFQCPFGLLPLKYLIRILAGLTIFIRK